MTMQYEYNRTRNRWDVTDSETGLLFAHFPPEIEEHTIKAYVVNTNLLDRIDARRTRFYNELVDRGEDPSAAAACVDAGFLSFDAWHAHHRAEDDRNHYYEL